MAGLGGAASAAAAQRSCLEGRAGHSLTQPAAGKHRTSPCSLGFLTTRVSPERPELGDPQAWSLEQYHVPCALGGVPCALGVGWHTSARGEGRRGETLLGLVWKILAITE